MNDYKSKWISQGYELIAEKNKHLQVMEEKNQIRAQLRVLALAVQFADEIFALKGCAKFGREELALAKRVLAEIEGDTSDD